MKKNDIVVKNNIKYKIVKVINKDYIKCEPVNKTFIQEIGDLTYYLKISEVKLSD